MSCGSFLRLGALKEVAQFQEYLKSGQLTIPCDTEILTGNESPLRTPLQRGAIKIRNRIAVQSRGAYSWVRSRQAPTPVLKKAVALLVPRR
jgi:hypothetical protein